MSTSSWLLLPGRSNTALACDIVEKSPCIDLCDVNISNFNDGELKIEVVTNVRDRNIIILQSLGPPSPNEDWVELVLLISTLKRSSAKSITCLLPYLGYSRQDRRSGKQVPISAADMCSIINDMGVDRVIAIDLHCGQIQGFFHADVPCDNLGGAKSVVSHISTEMDLDPHTTVLISPDAGGVERVKEFETLLRGRNFHPRGMGIIVKQRGGAGTVSSMNLVGDVKGYDVLIVDDMIDTAGTLCKAAQLLKECGAQRVFAFATHGLFSGPAIQRISESVLEKVIVTNSLVTASSAQEECTKISTLSLSTLILTHLHTIIGL